MKRIAERFAQLGAQGRRALITFITAGDPRPEATVPLMHALVAAGADVVELGVPFSDPMAEGPVIQAACERALRHHVNLHQVLDMVRDFRRDDADTPVVLMGYLNPIEVFGYAEFAAAAVAAGVDGVLTVDLPPEESSEFVATLQSQGLDTIFLVAPTSTSDRIRAITASSSGFVYYVSLKGVTGASHIDIGAVAEKVGEIRRHTQLPVGVGFGVKQPDHAARLAEVTDAVVVGSAIVRLIGEHADDLPKVNQHVGDLVREMRAAMDARPAVARQR